jgi:hypothetical protein
MCWGFSITYPAKQSVAFWHPESIFHWYKKSCKLYLEGKVQLDHNPLESIKQYCLIISRMYGGVSSVLKTMIQTWRAGRPVQIALSV